jgi:polysaccharide biosynthesis/export protein
MRIRSHFMVKICWRKSSLAVFFSIVSAACGAMPQNPPRAELASASAANASSSAPDINRNIAAAAMWGSSGASSDYRIGAEDLLEITIFNIPEAEGKITPRTVTARVSQQGQISLPLLGELNIKGLTIPEIEQRLRQGYDRYIFNPQVGVSVKEFRQKVSIIGAIQRPGVFELTGPKTLIEMLAVAGGVSEKAGSQVHIYRQGPKGRDTHIIDLAVLANSIGLITADNAAMINMQVEAGDVINIPEVGMFFVDGAVRKPGSYSLGRRYTLTQALATAGGVDPELNSSEVSIFRRNGPGKAETLAFDLNHILAGTAADPQIQPDDVVVLPISTAKFIVKRFVGTLVGGISVGSFFGGY